MLTSRALSRRAGGGTTSAAAAALRHVPAGGGQRALPAPKSRLASSQEGEEQDGGSSEGGAGSGAGSGQRRVLLSSAGVVGTLCGWLFTDTPEYLDRGVGDRARAALSEAYTRRVAFRDYQASEAALDWAQRYIQGKDLLERKRRQWEVEEGPELHRINLANAARLNDARGDFFFQKAEDPEKKDFAIENYQRALTNYQRVLTMLEQDIQPHNDRHANQLRLEKMLLRVKQVENFAGLGELEEAVKLLRKQLAELRDFASSVDLIECQLPPVVWCGEVYVMPSLDSAAGSAAVVRRVGSMRAFLRERLAVLLLRSVPSRHNPARRQREEETAAKEGTPLPPTDPATEAAETREWTARVSEAALLAGLALEGVKELPPTAPEVAHTLIAQRQVADELWRLGAFKDAEKVLEGTLKLARRADAAGGYVDPVASQLLVELECRLARVLLDLDRPDDAVFTVKKALQMVQFRPLFDTNPMLKYKKAANDFVDFVVLRGTGKINPIKPGPTGDYARHHRYTT